MRGLNIGAGQDIPTGDWIHLDKYPQGEYVRRYDVDEHHPPLDYFHDKEFDEVRCFGCINEFRHDVVVMMNEFWRVLRNEGLLDIRVAVVDGGRTGAFRDPVAKRYLSSEWVNYFAGTDEGRLTGGRGLGFVGKFEVVTNEVLGEVHHVVLRAIR